MAREGVAGQRSEHDIDYRNDRADDKAVEDGQWHALRLYAGGLARDEEPQLPKTTTLP